MEFRLQPMGFMEFFNKKFPEDCCFVKKNSMKPMNRNLNSMTLDI